jgi:type VI protein secretion system component VasK
MATSVSAISPRLICAVQDNPARMLAAAAAELAHRWEDCERGIDVEEWAADLGPLRDTLATLARLLSPEGPVRESAGAFEDQGDLPEGTAKHAAAAGHALARAAGSIASCAAGA